MKKQIKVWTLHSLLGMLIVLTSCSTITEDLPLCTHQLAFRYDYNMKFADAFPTAVQKLDVFIFDADERLVTQLTEERETFGEHFRLPLSLPDGSYHIIVWAGRYPRSYAFQEKLIPGKSTPNDLKTKVIRDETGKVSQELDALWYGETHASFSQEKPQTVTLHLTKDTNKFRIVVQGISCNQDTSLECSITDQNGCLGSDNHLLPDTPISYIPYFQKSVQIDGETSRTQVPVRYTGELKVWVAELNTSRLMESSHPRLHIQYPDGKTIMDLDLIQYLLLTKMEGHQMEAQEYLDRQDEYALIFFLTQNQEGQYIIMKVKVNGWTIRPQSGEF